MSNVNRGCTLTAIIHTDYAQRTERLPDAYSQAFVGVVKHRSTRSNQKRSLLGQRGTTDALPWCQQSFFLVRAFGSGTLEPPKVHGIRTQAFCLASRDNVSLKEGVARVFAPQRSSWVSHGGHQ